MSNYYKADEAKADAILSAYITNLGKYNEGRLVGKWHSFPTTTEEIAQTLKEIGIDGIHYEEIFITDYETSVDGIYDRLSEYASIDELNYLASKLDCLSSDELEVYEAAVEKGDYCGSIKDLINLVENLDGYDYLDGVDSEYDLGYCWVEESAAMTQRN